MNIFERLRKLRDEIPKPWIIPTHVFEAGIEVRYLKNSKLEFVLGNDGSMNQKGYEIYLGNCRNVCKKCGTCEIPNDITRRVISSVNGKPCVEYLPQIERQVPIKPFFTGVTVKDSSGCGSKVEIVLHNSGSDSDYLNVCRDVCDGDNCGFKRVNFCTGLDENGRAEAYGKNENTINALKIEPRPPCINNHHVRFSLKAKPNNSKWY